MQIRYNFKLLHINIMPFFAWIVGLFLSFLLFLFTKTFLNDGGFRQFSFELEFLIFTFFCIGGSTAVIYIFSIPTTLIYNKNNQLNIIALSIFKLIHYKGTLGDFDFYSQKDIDGEGDVIFKAFVKYKDNAEIYVGTHMSPEEAENLFSKIKNKF